MGFKYGIDHGTFLGVVDAIHSCSLAIEEFRSALAALRKRKQRTLEREREAKNRSRLGFWVALLLLAFLIYYFVL